LAAWDRVVGPERKWQNLGPTLSIATNHHWENFCWDCAEDNKKKFGLSHDDAEDKDNTDRGTTT